MSEDVDLPLFTAQVVNAVKCFTLHLLPAQLKCTVKKKLSKLLNDSHTHTHTRHEISI